MNAISSSVNKGALKVAPKTGGSRRSRPTQTRTKHTSVASIVPDNAQESELLPQGSHTISSDSARTVQNSVPVVAHAAHRVPDEVETIQPRERRGSSHSNLVNTNTHEEISTQAIDGRSPDLQSRARAIISPGIVDEHILRPQVSEEGSTVKSTNLQPSAGHDTGKPREAVQDQNEELANASKRTSNDHVTFIPSPLQNISVEKSHLNARITKPPTENVPQGHERGSRADRGLSSERSMNQIEALDSGIDASFKQETGGIRSRRSRNPRRKREVTPEEAEGQVIDSALTKMSDLCKDIRKGRKSNKYAEFAKIEAQRKKRLHPISASAENPDQIADKDSTEILDADLDIKLFERQMHNDVDLDDEAETDEEEELPLATTGAPQVRIVNGQIILDVNSLQVDRAVRDAADHTGSVEYVEENPLEKVVNSRSYSKHKVTSRWDAESTELFYSGLSQWGTDFDMISRMFPSRNRKQIKNKYTIEERKNPGLVTQALIQKKPVDMAEYSKITEISFRPIAELEGELAELKAKFEAEREDAMREVEQRKLEALDETAAQPLSNEGKKSAKRRRADDGLELVGSIEEVEEAARMAARSRAQSSDEEE